MEPTETYSLLTRLYDIGLKTEADKIRVEKLIEANDIKPEKCDAESFELMNSLSVDKAGDIIEQYLDSCIRRQFLLCRDSFSAQLKSSVDQLDKGTIDSLNLIKAASYKDYTMYSPLPIGFKPLEPPGLALLMDQFFYAHPETRDLRKTEHLLPKLIGVYVLVRQDRLSGICEHTLRVTKLPLNNYFALGDRPSVVKLFDNYARDWVGVLYLCHNILRGFELYQNQGKKLVTEAALQRYKDNLTYMSTRIRQK